MNLSNIALLNIKDSDYCCIISGISKNEAINLTLFRIGFFWDAHGWGGKTPLSEICHTYPAMMKPGTVILYQKKIKKVYESHDLPFEFC